MKAAVAPREACLPAVRCQIEQAQEKLVIACDVLRRHGFPEFADDLMRPARALRVWTQQDGFLDCMARPDAEDAP